MTNVIMNSELNGVEIYFDTKPIKTIIDGLKNVGYRWNRKKICWYAKQNEKTIEEAKKYTNNSIEVTDNKINLTTKKNDISLWDLTRWNEEITNNDKQETKVIAAEIRKHVRKRFSFCKFSVTSDYSSINFYIVSSPFEKDSIYLKAIEEYCTNLLKSYNYCTCYDPYGDYGSSYNFYGAYAKIAYDYVQTEETDTIKEMIKDFNIKQNEFDKAEEERKEKEYQEYEKKQAEQQKQYELRQQEEQKEIEAINNNIEITDLEESKQYFVMGSQFANLNKNNTLDQYKEEVLKGDYKSQNVKITREIHFKNKESLKYFSNLLLNDFEFLQGEYTGGSFTDDERVNTMTDFNNMTNEERQTVKWNLYGVAIYLNDKLQFIVDTQGYSYARYVGLVDNVTIQKEYTIEQVIDNEQLQELKNQAEKITDISSTIIDSNNLQKTWNNEDWNKYKDLMKIKLKNRNIKLTKSIIQQVTDDLDSLKASMYKLLTEVDGIQEQFKNADIKQGKKLTMFYISDWGSMVTNRITFDNVEYTSYAQYDNAVKITYTPQGKRKQYYGYWYSTLLVFDGWLELPDNVLNTIENKNGMTITRSKYLSCDNMQYDEILNHFEQQGLKPIINTYKPNL